ncbi:hypothetical protein [Streptomyces lavendofoliae]|uniref:Uncharacterized protein n=1 Tax=Streptomyces lavendofoliae TaxID=67314 RepID=A0A918I2I0_9ACTN|nr:hypothetical protein [Streptomyces lavendofoliae]GGU62188.1 hypothetical protein GCM10010274_58700 [Streptomyces lavendofoliae]
MADVHEPGAYYWNADSNYCRHGAEPDIENDDAAWDAWCDKHPISDDGRICLDAPAGQACLMCSAEHGDMVPWDRCEGRDHVRPARGVTPAPEPEHQPVPVWIGGLECLERECDDYFTDDGDDKPDVEICSHVREATSCSCRRVASGEYVLEPCPALLATAAKEN